MGQITARKLAIQLVSLTLLGLLSVSFYLIIANYQNNKRQYQQDILQRLESIAQTGVLTINSQPHEDIINEYQASKKVDESTANFKQLVKSLDEIKKVNHLHTKVYTIFADQNNAEKLYIGVSSGKDQYFGDVYTSHPTELLQLFEKGGQLHPYEDAHGTWLSAFAPIKNEKGQVVAIVQVDEKFDSFLKVVRKRAYQSILYSILVVALVAVILIYIIKRIIRIDKDKSSKLETAYLTVEHQNKKIKDSINYAQKIQESILPDFNEVKQHFTDAFMIYEAKDVVSGDFPWYYRRGDNVYIAAVDCTGHGVPGAMISFIGYFLLNDINGHTKCLTPGELLNELDEKVKSTLKQNDDDALSKDGMDIGLCRFNIKTKELHYAGAHRPLYVLKNGVLEQVKGDRKPIGGKVHPKLVGPFENHVVSLAQGDRCFIFSDGFPDQIGEESQKKYGPKRIREKIIESKKTSLKEFGTELEGDLKNWKGNERQLDDILLIGFEV